jgi:hypothetical protein
VLIKLGEVHTEDGEQGYELDEGDQFKWSKLTLGDKMKRSKHPEGKGIC